MFDIMDASTRDSIDIGKHLVREAACFNFSNLFFCEFAFIVCFAKTMSIFIYFVLHISCMRACK